ncbi:MAG: hypothetical protein ACYDBB_13915 [Armatimonadota bacterium]
MFHQMLDIRFWRRFMVPGVILATLAVWWGMRSCGAQQPRSPIAVHHEEEFRIQGYPIDNLPARVKLLKYVATFSMDGEGMDVLPTRAGFLTREGNDYLLHDWHDGHRRWRVNVNTGKGWGQPYSAWSAIDNPSFALSDDGRYFVTSTVEKHGIRVRRWHDGKPDGDCTVLASPGKPPKPGYYQLAIGSNGRICLEYFYGEGGAPSYLLALDGRRVIARGQLPAQARLLPGGSLAYNETSHNLYAIWVKAGHFRFTSVARIAPGFVQCPGNYLLARDGAVYTPAGRKLPPTPRHKVDENDSWCMSGLGYLSRVWPTDRLVFSPGGNRHEIYSLSTQTHWSFTSSSGMKGVAASVDGRYVLLHGKGGIKDGPHDNQGALVGGTDAIWLYERPGILRAALRFAADRIVPFEGKDDPRRVGESCNNWLLSPDGRSVILKYQYMRIGGIAVLYRW